jgi:hypothetical protein
MSTSTDWDRWLEAADSPNALAPEDYDDCAADARARELHFTLRRELPTYKVETHSPELYQDGTGLVESRITQPDAPDSALAWVLLSHFEGLATVARCEDSQLLTAIREVFEELRYNYIPYDYLERTTYHGMCGKLVGLSWANRYFAITPDYNSANDGYDGQDRTSQPPGD